MRILTAVLLSLGLASRVVAQATDLREARESLRTADIALSERASSSGFNITEGFAPDAVLIVSRREPLRVSAQIADWFRADTLSARGATWNPVRADVSADGLDGYTYGFITLRGADGVDRPGKYLAYWRRTPNGDWRMIAYKRLPRQDGPTGDVPQGFETPSVTTRRAFPGRERAIQEIVSTDQQFAQLAQRGAAAAFAKYTAADGATLGSGAEIAYGPQRAAREFQAFAPGSIDWNPMHADAASSGDLGFAYGPVIIRENGTRQRTAAYYLTIWQRQRDGRWRVIIDG